MFRGKAILFYSGGKDSIALLHVMREYLDRCLVTWINTGDALPELREHMDGIKSRVPHFREVKSDVMGDIDKNGYPVDVLPISSGRFMNGIGLGSLKLRSWDQCCHNNIWWPTQVLLDECKGEYSTIIRGQKSADRLHAPTYSGQHIEGYDILYPLEDWTDKHVFEYIEKNGLDLPKHYNYFKSSIDCWACTAHTHDNQGKLEYLLEFHPEKGQELGRRMQTIIQEVDREMAHVRNFMEPR